MMTFSALIVTALLVPASDLPTAGATGDSAALAGMYEEGARYVSGHVQNLVAEGRDRVIANFRAGVLMGGHIDAVTVV